MESFIKALKIDEAIDVLVFRKNMIQKYERMDPSPDIVYTVETVNIDSTTQVDDNVTKREDMPIKMPHN
jgi:hypothetical protein